MICKLSELDVCVLEFNGVKLVPGSQHTLQSLFVRCC